MPRAKRASDEVYNERRRQRRALARLKRAGAITKEGAARVEAQIAQTYQKTRKKGQALKETVRQTRALAQSRAKLTEERTTSFNYRSDKVMQISMRAAHKKSGTSKRTHAHFLDFDTATLANGQVRRKRAPTLCHA